eukprot:5466870-Pyramimonas_sp.AAC.1
MGPIRKVKGHMSSDDVAGDDHLTFPRRVTTSPITMLSLERWPMRSRALSSRSGSIEPSPFLVKFVCLPPVCSVVCEARKGENERR